MARLGVNIEKAALLRAGSKNPDPDPVSIAVLAEIGGADGIVCRLRKDMKLIKERDVKMLKEIVKTHLNIQIAPEEELLSLALSIQPDMITLVPEKSAGSTEGGGFDVLGRTSFFEKIISEIRNHGIVVNIAVDPVFQQVKAAARAGTDYVELQMARYSGAEDLVECSDQIEAVKSAAMGAAKLGVGVSASGGLNYQNISEIAQIENVEEINIGHAILSRAMFIGIEAAVRDMVALVH